MLKDLKVALRKRNPQVERAAAEWLGAIPWQLFGTATFPKRVSHEHAEQAFRLFLDHLEERIRDRVCCAYTQESESKRHGTRVGQHFHFVLTSRKIISLNVVVELWNTLIDRPREPENAHMVAKRFRSELGGLEYIAKMYDDLSATPKEHNLMFFMPGALQNAKKTRRQARHLRRWSKRQNSLV